VPSCGKLSWVHGTLLCWIPLLILAGCASHRDVSRVASPDGKVEAVLDEVNGGATTSYSYALYLVPKGATKFPSKDMVFVADHIEDLHLEWAESKLLHIKYREARIFQFSNFWQNKEVDSFQYVVELRLMPMTDHWSLNPRDRHSHPR